MRYEIYIGNCGLKPRGEATLEKGSCRQEVWSGLVICCRRSFWFSGSVSMFSLNGDNIKVDLAQVKREAVDWVGWNGEFLCTK